MSFPMDEAVPEQEEPIFHALTPPNSQEVVKRARWKFAHALIAPLEIQNFRLLLSGQTISYMGDTLYAVALPWIVLTSQHGSQALSIVLTIYGFARISTLLVGGALSDWLGPCRLMVLTDLVRASILGTFAVLIFWRTPTLWQLCIFTALLGIFQGLFSPASLAIMPDLLTDTQLPAGNSLSIASLQIATLLGFFFAGFVVNALHPDLALAGDALSFIASAATLLAIRGVATERKRPGRTQARDTTQKQSGDREETLLTFGQFLRRSRMFQVVLIIVVISNISVGSFEVTLPSLIQSVLKAGASGYGLMLAAFQAGVLVGVLSTGILGNTSKRAVKGLCLWIIEAGLICIIPFAGSLMGVIFILLSIGILVGITNTLFFIIMQEKIPAHLLGRTMGAITFAAGISYPFAVAATGFLITSFGLTMLFPSSGLLLLFSVLIGLSQREIRDL